MTPAATGFERTLTTAIKETSLVCLLAIRATSQVYYECLLELETLEQNYFLPRAHSKHCTN